MTFINDLLDKKYLNNDYSDQIKWLIELFKWLKLPTKNESTISLNENTYSLKLRLLLEILENKPHWKLNFTSNISSILNTMSSVHIFTDVGMSAHSSFIHEFIKRIEDKILPQNVLSENLSSLLFEIFSAKNESQLFEEINNDVFADLVKLFANDKVLINRLKEDILNSLYILITQLLSNAILIQNEIEGSVISTNDWPEVQIHELISKNKNGLNQNVILDFFEILKKCENHRIIFYNLMQEKGIKVNSVFLLESQRRRLERIFSLLTILDSEKSDAKTIHQFISMLIKDIYHQKSLVSFLGENMNLLTQRIVSRNSDVGEHYVTTNWKEFSKMYFSALGGGAITSLTVYIKFGLSNLGTTNFIKGFLDSLNYTTSFIFIQSLGFTLATKQPSATAPYLAQSLKSNNVDSHKAVIAILRTQFIAVLGNLTLVFPICFGISWFSLYFFDKQIMTLSESAIVFNSTNILGTSPLFAAFTGLLLFLSSLLAGWFDNWMAIHNVPKRIFYHQHLIKYLGKIRTRKISLFLKKNVNSFAASISLGFLLGLTPQFVKFFGIPIEVRHITLSTGSFAAALPIMSGQNLDYFKYFNSVLGLIAIGIINISVSFGLALVLASISTQVKFIQIWNLLKWGTFYIFLKPWLLIIPESVEKKDHSA